MNILIVDDSRTMRMIVRRTLRQANIGEHTYEEAENGRDALERLKTFRADLILSDWNMPEMEHLAHDLDAVIRRADDLDARNPPQACREREARARGVVRDHHANRPRAHGACTSRLASRPAVPANT